MNYKHKIMKSFLTSLVFFVSIGVISGQTWLDNNCSLDEKIYNEQYTSAKANNVLTLVFNQEGNLLINNKKSEGLSEIKFKETVYEFLANPSKDKTKADSPKQAIIALGTYGKNESYDLILRYVREVYLYTWDTAAEEKYGDLYMDLDCKKRKKIRNNSFPYNVLELDKKKDDKKPKMTIGVPPFAGDVLDN